MTYVGYVWDPNNYSDDHTTVIWLNLVGVIVKHKPQIRGC